MSSNTPLTDSINNLTTYANSVTGASDTNLSDAVATLASGYGQGSGGVDINALNDKTISGHVVVTGTSLRALLFAGCDLITSVSCPNAINGYGVRQGGTNRNGSQFEDCTSLQSAEFPVMTNPTDSMFMRCAALTHVYFPVATSVPTLLFNLCTSLETVVMPSVDGMVYTSAFQDCTDLKSVDLYKPNFGRTLIFNRCSSLDTLVVRNTSASALGNVNVFDGTPFASGGTGGTLYVPSDLISTYQSKANWSTILGYTNNQIKSIESTHTDPNAPIDLTLYYADGTAIASS